MVQTSLPSGSPQFASKSKPWWRRRAHSLLLAVYRRTPKRLRYLGVWLLSPKITLGVAACIQDDSGRVLLAHHTYRRKTAWSLPGGYVRAEEEPALALVREMGEEMGVRLTVGPVFGAYAWPRGRHLTLFYRASISGLPRADGVEIDELRWVTLDEAARLTGAIGRPWLEALAQTGPYLHFSTSFTDGDDAPRAAGEQPISVDGEADVTRQDALGRPSPTRP